MQKADAGERRTLRWREMDSNHRSPARKSRFLLRKANCGTERGQPKKGCFLCGTDGSNPSPSSKESANFRSLSGRTDRREKHVTSQTNYWRCVRCSRSGMDTEGYLWSLRQRSTSSRNSLRVHVSRSLPSRSISSLGKRDRTSALE